MRKPSAIFRVLALLAIVSGIIYVAHDAVESLPFWWTHAFAAERFERRVAAAGGDRNRLLRELQGVPANDPRGLSFLVDTLSHPDPVLRQLSLQVMNEQIDCWRLTASAVGGVRLVDLLGALDDRVREKPVAYQFAGRNLIDRIQQLQLNPHSDTGKFCLDTCASIAQTLRESRPQLRTARRSDAFGDPDVEEFEDQFELPGGGLSHP